MPLSYEDIVQGAYSSIGRTGMGNAVGQIDPEGYKFWLDALKAGVVSPDQLYANFNKSVAETVQQQPQVANSQAVASYIAANPLATQIDPKKVVAVGDSTTWGYNQGNQVADNMVTTAQKALGSDYSVSNLGINSTTAGDFLNSADFDKALSSGAGTVVLNYGMNEAYRNEDPATFANNLLTAVQTLQAVGKKVILQTPNSTSSTDAWAQNVGTYADVVRSVSQQTGSTLDDKYTYTSGLSNATSATDPIHPTAATYGLLGNNLADAIKTTTTGVAPKAISVTAPAAAAKPVDTSATTVQGDVGFTSNNAAAVTTQASSEDIITKIKNQILAQGTTDKWSGEGFGSAEKNATDMAKIIAGTGVTDISQFGQIQKTVVDENGTESVVSTYGNKVTGQEVPNTYSERQTGNAFGGTFTGKGNTGYRVEMAPNGTPIFYTTGASSSDADQWMPIVQLALAATGAGGLLGNALLGAGANQIAAGALGGSILGGGISALTGQDILKGALTGGIGGGIAGYFSPSTGQITETAVSSDSVPFTSADYSLATGTQFNPLTDMGGAQGLQAGTSANLANMGGGQGITLNLGPASTTLANALSTFGGMNPANLDAMGGAQGLTYQTPTGLVTQGGVIPTGGSTGNNNVIGETGVNTAYNIGNGIGDALAAVDTGVYDPTKGMLSSTVTGFNADGTPTTNTSTTNILDKLTPGQIANIVGGLGGLLGGAAITSGGGAGGGMGVGAIPTQGVPLNTADYYNAIQQNYNRLLPAVPRDVATPLAQWYNSTYGA